MLSFYDGRWDGFGGEYFDVVSFCFKSCEGFCGCCYVGCVDEVLFFGVFDDIEISVRYDD